MDTFEYLEHAQRGDEQATLYLISKFTPLLKKYARKLAYEDAYDDLLADYIALLRQMRLTKLCNKTDGGCHAYIATAIHSFYVKQMAQVVKQRGQVLFADLSDAVLGYIQSIPPTRDPYERADFSFVESLLSAQESQVIKLVFYDGYTAAEIASLQGVSRQAINQTKNRALKKTSKRVAITKRKYNNGYSTILCGKGTIRHSRCT